MGRIMVVNPPERPSFCHGHSKLAPINTSDHWRQSAGSPCASAQGTISGARSGVMRRRKRPLMARRAYSFINHRRS
jgi:hypothetical protein